MNTEAPADADWLILCSTVFASMVKEHSNYEVGGSVVADGGGESFDVHFNRTLRIRINPRIRSDRCTS